MTYTKKEKAEYNEQRQRTCDALGIAGNDYNAFRRLGEKLRKIYADNCNGGVYEVEGSYEAACHPLEQKAGKMAAKYGLHIYFQTDPRGATIYLDKTPINNDYSSAHCIY